jgi:hypothetical protein
LDDIALEDLIAFLQKRVKEEYIANSSELYRGICKLKMRIEALYIDLVFLKFRYNEIINIVSSGTAFLITVDVCNFHVCIDGLF